MAKIEYEATCLCGGQIQTVFKKPTRFQASIKRATCKGCGSEFMFTYTIEYHEGNRAYVPEHKVTHMTEKLHEALKAKSEQPKEASA